ncbi:hypothetical protein F4677DRAFT_462978 [Hypoxylon crocopeplum]|nr:hypothetical protein F4677DRAFT_462978 [Hypoxylon crocopeplum]
MLTRTMAYTPRPNHGTEGDRLKYAAKNEPAENIFHFEHGTTNQFLCLVYLQEINHCDAHEQQDGPDWGVTKVEESETKVTDDFVDLEVTSFESWGQLTSQLRMHSIRQIREHDHIAQIRRVFLSPPDIFANELPPKILYETFEIGTLTSYLESEETELLGYEPLQICSDVAEGLSALHQHGIAHNDVRCDNVLLFRSEKSNNRLSAKLAGFGSISCCSGARVPTPWAAAPELFTPRSNNDGGTDGLGETTDPSGHGGLLAPTGTSHDLYSLGLLCWAVHLRSANPFLHGLFEEAVLTPSQTAARHWAQISFQSSRCVSKPQTESGCTRSSSELSRTVLKAVQLLKADSSDRLLRVIEHTSKVSDATDSSSYLQKAVSCLCLHSPQSRSMGAAITALQGKRNFFSPVTENQDKGETSIWEKGWILSLQPESRMTSFNQHLAIQGSTSSLLSESSKLEESSLHRLYEGLIHLRKQHATVVFEQNHILKVCQFLDSVIEEAVLDKRPEVAIVAREAALALFELHMDRLGSTTATDITENALSALRKAVVLENEWSLYPLGTSIYLRFHHAMRPKTLVHKSVWGKESSSHRLRGTAIGLEDAVSFQPYDALNELQRRFLPLADCEASLRRLLAKFSESEREFSGEDFISALLQLASRRTWRKNPLATETLDDQGTTALHYAVRSQLLPVAKCLVKEMNLDIHVVDNLLNTPLHYAVWVGDRAIVEFLVHHGASPLKKNFLGQLPVHLVYNVPPADLDSVMKSLYIAPGVDYDTRQSLFRTGFGTHSVDPSSSKTTSLLLQAIAFRRPDIVCQMLSMSPSLLEDESSVEVLEQAFRHQIAYQLIAPAMSTHVLQTMVNPWKLLSLALEAKPDQRILWHGSNYIAELRWLFEFVLSYFHDELLSYAPEMLFYQALRTNNADIISTIWDWKDTLPADSEDVLRPGINKSLRLSCLYGDMQSGGKTLPRTWACLNDTQRREILSDHATSDAFLAAAVTQSSSSAKNKNKTVRWLLKRGFRPQVAGFVEVLKSRDRKCAMLLFLNLEADVFELATRVMDEAVGVGSWLLQDFVAVVNHTKRVRKGKASPIERLMVADVHAENTTSRKFCLLDHFTRSPAYANPPCDPISHRNFQDVLRFLCGLFQDAASGSPLCDVAPLEFALFRWRPHVVDIFLEFTSDEALLNLAGLWWVTPKFSEAGLEILEFIMRNEKLLSSGLSLSEDNVSPSLFQRLFLPPLKFRHFLAENGGLHNSMTTMANVIRKHTKMRSGRVRTRPLSVKCWEIILNKILRLDESQWLWNGQNDDILSEFYASVSGRELVTALQCLKPEIHALDKIIEVYNGERPSPPPVVSVFDRRQDRGQFFGLGRKEMLVAVFGFLLSPPTSLSPSDSLLSVFGLSRPAFNSGRKKWHTTVDHLLILRIMDKTNNGNTLKEDGWARSEMRMEIFLQLISATPVGNPKPVREPYTSDPLPISITPATVWDFIKDGQRLQRTTHQGGSHASYNCADLVEELD